MAAWEKLRGESVSHRRRQSSPSTDDVREHQREGAGSLLVAAFPKGISLLILYFTAFITCVPAASCNVLCLKLTSRGLYKVQDAHRTVGAAAFRGRAYQCL